MDLWVYNNNIFAILDGELMHILAAKLAQISPNYIVI